MQPRNINKFEVFNTMTPDAAAVKSRETTKDKTTRSIKRWIKKTPRIGMQRLKFQVFTVVRHSFFF